MDDFAIDRYITRQIEKRGITLYDMIEDGDVDPTPQIMDPPFSQRVRPNKFHCTDWDLRLCELLTRGRFDPEDPYRNLAIPLKDLVRYWWNTRADHDLFLERVFEDILLVYKERYLEVLD